jgi:hypothetical protein
MAAAIYCIDLGFEARKSILSEGVHPARLRVLHMQVHLRAAYDYAFDPRATAREYVAFLELSTEAVDHLERGFLEQAETACVNVAEFSLVSSSRQMPQAVAASLATAWIAKFDECTSFFLSAWGVLDSPPDSSGGGFELFHTDLEGGVLAVSPTKAGLFWSAEDS